MNTKIFATSVFIVAAHSAAAGEAVTYTYDGTFDDATFAVETAIVDRGLVVDSVSHVGEMLNRTGEDVGSGTRIFEAADVFNFCSAVVSREVMEADPMNIVHCPYNIFVIDTGNAVMIGHQAYEGTMAPVHDLLSDIASEASEF